MTVLPLHSIGTPHAPWGTPWKEYTTSTRVRSDSYREDNKPIRFT
jgi:hypothetical protein